MPPAIRLFSCLPLLVILIVPGLQVSVFSQPAINKVSHLTVQDGLSDRQVNELLLDSRGFLWLGTNNGLNLYDGRAFNVFDNSTGSKYQIEQNRITGLIELENDQLLMLNDRKDPFLEMLDLRTYSSRLIKLNVANGLRGKILAIYGEKLGKVYVLSEDRGAYVVSTLQNDLLFKEVCSFSPKNKRPGEQTKFIRSASGNFWLSDAANGIFEVSAKGDLRYQKSITEIHSLLSKSDISYETGLLHEDRQGRVWASFPFYQGLLLKTPEAQDLALAPGLPENEVYTKIWEDGKGNLLAGTFFTFGKLGKLYKIDGLGAAEDYQWVLDIENKINDIHGLDFDQLIILGTHVGLYKISLSNRQIRWVLADRPLEDSQWDDGISIRNITGDGKGNVYISRELKAWYHLKVPSFKIEELPIKKADGSPLQLWCCSNLVYDPAGFLWGGSCSDNRDGLLHRYDFSTGITSSYPVSNKVIQHILQLDDGRLLLASGAEDADGQLHFFDPGLKTFQLYRDRDEHNPLEGRLPRYLLEGEQGMIWVGTDEGLAGIDLKNKTSRIFNRSNTGISNDYILVIHKDESGKLWLGTQGGLNILDPATGQAKVYNGNKGLCNNTVCGILPDGDGHYWISTFYGLSRFDPETELFDNFFQEKGLSFNEFNRLSFYRDENDFFYFGSLNGINVFRNEDMQDKSQDPFPLQWKKIVIYKNDGQAQTKDKGFTNTEQVVLAQQDDFMHLEFFLPNYLDSERNQYAIKLEGQDTVWRLLGTNPVAEINRPKPGKYLMRIKAAPAGGFWMEEELTLSLEVRQAFYQAFWFQLTMPILVILLSYLFARWIINRIRKKEARQTQINKRFAELELQALQSQMNPHFVFNSLGAIQYFIQNNDAEAADNYLAKFAKLMRLFLESSKNRYILLVEEIKLLSLYIELEQMRYEDKFVANIEVDKKINTHSRELPSILLQPFVENAINHGLFHKKTNGILKISFQAGPDDQLICTIVDNGIGRKKAQLIKEKSPRNHKSRGMQILSERLEVLELVEEMRISVTVNDLHPKQPETGTIVTITIPNPD